MPRFSDRRHLIRPIVTQGHTGDVLPTNLSTTHAQHPVAPYDAIIISSGIHPRAIRTMEYADHCDEVWNDNLPVPSFESWRRDADRYVDIESSPDSYS